MRAEQLVGVAAEAGGDAVDRLLAAHLLGEEFRGAGNVAQCVGRQLHRRTIGDPGELALGEWLAVEEDGFHVAVLWIVVRDDTESSCGSGFSRELLPWPLLLRRQGEAGRGCPRFALIRKTPLPSPPLPSQGREPGLATDSVSSVMTSAPRAAVASSRPRSPRDRKSTRLNSSH